MFVASTLTRPTQRALALLAVTAVLLVGLGRLQPAAAVDICHRWAAGTGNDANDGSQLRPVATIRRLAVVLQPGETGCLRNGTTISTAGGWGILTEGGLPGQPITIRSEPGGKATVSGQIHVQRSVTDVVLRDLVLAGPSTLSQGSTLLIVDGDRTSLVGNDISHPRGICVDVGHVSGWDRTDATPATVDFVLDRNRVHDCGMDPNNVFSQTDSGAHGIYLVHTRNARITNNFVYRNRWRGLQTWPKADGTLIANNVFDQNATQVNVGSSLTEAGPWYSSNTVVRDNIMSNRVTDYRPEKNPANIYGNFPTGSPTYGNQAFGNCIDTRGGAATGGNGIAFGANPSGNVVYVNRAAGDFRLAEGSPCAGKGPLPAAVTPTPTPTPSSLAVSATAPAAAGTGDVVAHTVTVTNPGATTVSGGVLTFARTGAAGTAATNVTGGGCAATPCTLPDLPPGASVTLTLTYGAASAGTLGTTARVTPGDATAGAATTISGRTCTVRGAFGGETLTGTAGDDVLCGFSGNDTLRPRGGTDVVLGGSGTDVVSYLDATGAVVVNLGQSSAWDNGNGAAGWDTFTSIEAAEGSAYADTLVGLPTADTLRGAGGADRLLGYGGNDRLFGGDGGDRLDGGAGTDTCRQDAGVGTLTACEL